MAQTIGSLLIQIQADTAKLNEQMRDVQNHLKKTDKAAQQLKNTLLSFASIYTLKRLADSVIDATTTFQGWQYTLEAGGLSAKQTAEELAFLQTTAEKLGISIKDTGTSFSRLILTGQAAGIPLKELNEDFSAATAGMRIFHLNEQQTTRSWLALTEIMSMGTVKSRQFSRQLSIDWPGVGALIAKTMFKGKDSLEKFQEAMKKGEISARAFMHAIVQMMEDPAMQSALAGAVDSLQAAIGRFHTALFNLFNQANNTNLDTAISAINDFTKVLNDPNVQKGFSAIITGLMNIAYYAAQVISGWTQIATAIGVGMAELGGADANVGLEKTKKLIADTQHEITQLQNAIAKGYSLPGDDKKLAAAKITLKLYQDAAKYESGHPNGDSPLKLDPTNVLPRYKGMADGATKAKDAITKLIEKLKAQNSAVNKSASQILEYRVMYGDLAKDMKAAPIGKQIDLYNQLIQSGVKEINKSMTEINMHPLIEHLKKASTEMSVFADQAARNIQSILGDGLYNALNGKFDNIFKSFADMIKKMIAQILALKMLNGMFGGFDPTGKGSGSAGLAALFDFSGSIKTGPGHAAGGPVSAGTAYPVGEKGPEWFMPNTNGTIIPHGGMGGHYNASFHIDARGADSQTAARLMAMLPELRRMWIGDIQTVNQRGGVPMV